MPENTPLQHLLSKPYSPLDTSEIGRTMDFFKMILEIEREKEADVDKTFPYPFNYQGPDRKTILIDLPCNESFLRLYNENAHQAFHKDLYVEVAFFPSNNRNLTFAFSLIIDYTDLKDFDPMSQLLPIRVADLSIDPRLFEKLEIATDQQVEIERAVSNANNFNDLSSIAHNFFGQGVTLETELNLALSSKSIALAQIYSEISRLTAASVNANELLRHFLTHTAFNNAIGNISLAELISVSTLDNSQAAAVAHALNNRLTVITGAPGTGKTQVILNIIVNALLRDKKVLVASKNNKAVDNVKERFDQIESSGYLLRFGSKSHVRSQTVPALDARINHIDANIDNPTEADQLLSIFQRKISEIRHAEEKLERLSNLEVSIPQLCAQKSEIETKITQEEALTLATIEALRHEHSDVCHIELSAEAISEITSQLIKFRNSLQRKYSGLFGFMYNLFAKRNHALKFLEYVEDLPYSIKKHIRNLPIRKILTTSSLAKILLLIYRL